MKDMKVTKFGRGVEKKKDIGLEKKRTFISFISFTFKF